MSAKGSALLRKAAATQLDRLYRAKVMRHLHSVVMVHISATRWYQTEQVATDTASNVLRDKLNAEIARASGDALLLGDLTQDKKLKAEALHLTHGWLLKTNAGVMQFMEMSGQSPGRYLSEVHEELKHAIQSELADIVKFDEYPLPEDVPTLQGMVAGLNKKMLEQHARVQELLRELAKKEEV